jgi:hypothetical protein
VKDRLDRAVEKSGLLEAHETEADGSFVDRDAEDVPDAMRQVRDRRLPVAEAEHLHGDMIEAVRLVPLQIVNEKLVTEITRHEPVCACPRSNGLHAHTPTR